MLLASAMSPAFAQDAGDAATTLVALNHLWQAGLGEDELAQLGVQLDARGNLAVDERYATNVPNVFAGGDAVTGAATVIKAMGAGKKAAAAIDAYIKSK